MTKFIKPSEAAKRSSLSRTTIYALINSSAPPFRVKRVGDRLLIDEVSFEMWLGSTPVAGGFSLDGDGKTFKKTFDSLRALLGLRYAAGELLDALDLVRTRLATMPHIMYIAEAGDRTQPLDEQQRRDILIEIAQGLAATDSDVAGYLAKLRAL